MASILDQLPPKPEFVADPAYQPFTEEEQAQIDALTQLTMDEVEARTGRDYHATTQEFYAIDSLYSADRDDAIALERHADGSITLHVAIADVAAFIEKGSPLDLRGIAQAVTRYGEPEKGKNGKTEQLRVNVFGDALSEQYMSLASHADPANVAEQYPHLAADDTHDNLLLVCSVTLDGDDKVVRTEISRQRGKIHRLSKKEAGQWIFENRENFEHLADELAMRLGNRRLSNPHYDVFTGAFDVERQEIPSAEDGQMTQEEAGVATVQLMIQEAMILTNQETARIMDASGIPYMFRNHPITVHYTEQGQTRVQSVFDSETMQHLFDEQKRGRINIRFIEPDRAKVESTMRGHMGLGMMFYAWWTSPIRRYTDLVNQRTSHYLLDVIEQLRDAAPEVDVDALWDYAENGQDHGATALLYGLVHLHDFGNAAPLQDLFNEWGVQDVDVVMQAMQDAPLPYGQEEVDFIAGVFNERFSREKAKESARPRKKDSVSPNDWRDPAADLELLVKVFPAPDYEKLVRDERHPHGQVKSYSKSGFAKVVQAALQQPTAVFPEDAPITDEALATVQAACLKRMEEKRLSAEVYSMVFSIADPDGLWEDVRQAMWEHVRQEPELAEKVVRKLGMPDGYALSQSFHMQVPFEPEWLDIDVREADVVMGDDERKRHAGLVVATAPDGSLWTAEGTPLALTDAHTARVHVKRDAAVAFLDAYMEGRLQPLDRAQVPMELWKLQKSGPMFQGKIGKQPFEDYLQELGEATSQRAERFLPQADAALIQVAVAEALQSKKSQKQKYKDLQRLIKDVVPAAEGERLDGDMLTAEELLKEMVQHMGYDMSIKTRQTGARKKSQRQWQTTVTITHEAEDVAYDIQQQSSRKRASRDNAVAEAMQFVEDMHPQFFENMRDEVDQLQAMQLPQLARQTIEEDHVRFEPVTEVA
jgi:hypothetical protein